ncbi:MAG: hypothetical protein HY534_06350 [Chloroflexi bacterium]|nr:hypothetical protein [Chloroflexota bacterium]
MAAVYAAVLGTYVTHPALAQDTTEALTLQGQIINATRGTIGPPIGQKVQVVALNENQSLGTWEGTTDDSGRFRLEDIPRHAGATYIVGTDYGGVSYVERIELETETQVETTFNVYESSASDPGIRMERSSLIFSEVNADAQTITLLEVHRLLNPTDRTFLPQADGAGGPSGLLVFGLPAHAFQLTPHLGLDPAGIVQIDRGFASLAPVRPGRTEIAFSYQFPFSESSYLFQRTLRYPADALHIFSPAGGPSISAEGFPAPRDTVVGDRRYREIDGNALTAGTMVKLTIGQLPAPPGFSFPVTPAPIAIVGVFMGIAIVLAAWWTARDRVAATAPEERVIEDLIALDRDHAAGRVDEAEYLRARDRLLAQQPTDHAPEAATP